MALHSTNRLGASVSPDVQESVESYAPHNNNFPSPEFFQGPSIFKTLKKIIYPSILKHRLPGSPVRIWVPGSTGEFVYSIAMSLLEYLGSRASDTAIRIFGTSVDEDAISVARRGRFGMDISKSVSNEHLSRFFTPINGGYELSPAVRDICIFATHDVAKDPPFGNLDLLIFATLVRCSQAGSQQTLLPSLHFALKPHGLLILADAPPVAAIEKMFSLKDSKSGLYERRQISRRDQLQLLLQRNRERFQPIRSPGDETAQRRNSKRRAVFKSPQGHSADSQHLQQAIETNQQLYSRNREILSSNIELQTTAEDLQAKNYDLHRTADESEEKFRVFVENASVAIVMCDEEGTIVSVNARTERMFGYLRDELIGGSIRILIPDIFRAGYVSNRGTVTFKRIETHGCDQGGSQIPVEVTLRPIQTSHRTLFAATIADITERRQAAEQARWAAVLEERARLARDIHDTLAQGLTGIILNLDAIEEECLRLPVDVRNRIERARDVARRNLQEARRSISALSTSSRAPGGLATSIHEMAASATKASNTRVRFSLHGMARPLDGTVEENLFFIARQATDNALQHGNPTIIHIGLSFDERSICLRVQDDGNGFEIRAMNNGFGVRSMRERALYIGSHLLLKSQPGKGTVVKAVVPLTRTSPVVQ